jgi:hypothetical protein
MIDGRIAWVEHKPPYVYGNDGNWLVTSALEPGTHRFTVKTTTIDLRTVSRTVRASVVPAPAPPAELAGSWQRTVTKEQSRLRDSGGRLGHHHRPLRMDHLGSRRVSRLPVRRLDRRRLPLRQPPRAAQRDLDEDGDRPDRHALRQRLVQRYQCRGGLHLDRGGEHPHAYAQRARPVRRPGRQAGRSPGRCLDTGRVAATHGRRRAGR